MNKIIHIFILTHILSSITYADLTNTEMEKYWKNSRAQYMFIHSKKNLERDLFKILNIKKEDVNQALQNTIDTFVNNPKYLEKYKNTFFSIDVSIYKKLNKFYHTDLGKKYKKITNLIDYRSYEYVKNKYENLIKNNPISKEKMELISNIDEELNLVDIKIDFVRKLTTYKEKVLFPEDNVTDSQIDRYMLKYKTIAKQYEVMVMPILYNNFTIKELKKILKYASSKILAIEVEYIYKASHEFSKQSLKDIKENMKEFMNIRLCQNYKKSDKYIPKDCKEEWLSSDINTTE